MDGLVQEWFRRAVRRYPGKSMLLVVLSIATSLADGLSISLLIPFLSTLFNGEEAATGGGFLDSIVAVLTGWAGPGNALPALSFLIVLLVTVKTVLGYIESLISNWVSGQISCELRSQIHQNLLDTEFEFLCVNDNARLLNTLDSETWSATEAITIFFGLFTNLCMIAVFTTILLLISWELTLVVAALVAGVSGVMMLFNRRARAIGRESVSAAEDLSERAVELFDAMRMIRAFGREPDAQARYDRASHRLFDVSMRSVRVRGAAGSAQEILQAVTFVVLVFAGLGFGIEGAVLIAYLALLHRLNPHVRAIFDARLHLAELAASIKAVSDLLALPRWNAMGTTGFRLSELRQAIAFRDVTFAYSGKDKEERNALDHVSLEIPIKKVTAIVGWSGAGKTTLTNLLFRFYDPRMGTITVDGVPLPRLDLAWWRSQLAIAGQDADLINGTIRENIAYGREGATFEEIVAAAKRASAHEFIEALPRGYDTRVGSRGVLLSGGQRQRIGLARALVRGNGLLVLDEATNSLDSMTESEILKALEELRGHVTVIVIAHRLSTTRMADQVAVLSAGRVVEAGPPEMLYRQNGLYRRMVELQELSWSQGADSLAANDGSHL